MREGGGERETERDVCTGAREETEWKLIGGGGWGGRS